MSRTAGKANLPARVEEAASSRPEERKRRAREPHHEIENGSLVRRIGAAPLDSVPHAPEQEHPHDCAPAHVEEVGGAPTLALMRE